MTTAKKGPSKMKLVDGDKGKRKDQESMERMFETQRQGMLATMEVQLRQDLRFDTLMGIREAWHRFYFDAPETEGPSFDFVQSVAKDVRETHERINREIQEMTLEQFSAEEWENPADQFVQFPEVKDWEDVFYQSVIFAGVQPYGASFDDLRSRVMKELKDRA